MTATVPFVTVDEYLNTDYSPDCDYVEGAIEERNLGTSPHSRLQLAFVILLQRHERSLGIRVFPEQRVQTRLRRFRVPDVCVTLKPTTESVFRLPPLLCVEVLSPEDRMSRVEARLSEYFEMGVRYVWVVDPISHEAWTFSETGKQSVTDGILRTTNPDLTVSLKKAFKLAES